jgi:hypothetical protein
MKRFAFLVLLIAASGFAQKEKPFEYTIKKEGNLEIKLVLPTGTVVNPGNKVTIDQWQVAIETTPAEPYVMENLKGRDRNIGILSAYNAKGVKIPEDYSQRQTTESQFRTTENGTFILLSKDIYTDEEHPEKLIVARVTGNYILSLTIVNDIGDAEQAKKQLIDILDRTTVTQNGKPWIAPE